MTSERTKTSRTHRAQSPPSALSRAASRAARCSSSRCWRRRSRRSSFCAWRSRRASRARAGACSACCPSSATSIRCSSSSRCSCCCPRWGGTGIGVGRAEAPAEPLGKRRLVRLTAVVVGVALMAFFVRSSVAGVVRVVGPSMLPTLEIGDRVLVNRVAYGFTLPFTKAKSRERLARPHAAATSSCSPRRFRGRRRTSAAGQARAGVPGDTIDGERGLRPHQRLARPRSVTPALTP